MIVSLDKSKCKKCGICIERMSGYCITQDGGYPVLNEVLCNTCQKCVSICPSQAIAVNGIFPEKIRLNETLTADQLVSFMEKRRSIKKFLDKKVPRADIERIVSAAKYAPNQNKNISLRVIDDPALLNQIDCYGVRFVERMYRMLFGFPPVTFLIRLFYKDIDVVCEKMKHSNFSYSIYPNTQVIILAVGDKKVPFTESSAHYVLSSMVYMAEAVGVGSCLMDTVYLTFLTSKKLRRLFKIREDVLGAMALGYSDEKIVNIPKGYELEITYNR